MLNLFNTILTCSECFLGYLRLRWTGIGGVKDTDIGVFCTRGICIKGASIKDDSIRSAYIQSTCLCNTRIRSACTLGVYVAGIYNSAIEHSKIYSQLFWISKVGWYGTRLKTRVEAI